MLLAFDVGYILLWAAMINESFVRQAGREYAEALFRTLDAPSNPPTPKASAKKRTRPAFKSQEDAMAPLPFFYIPSRCGFEMLG